MAQLHAVYYKSSDKDAFNRKAFSYERVVGRTKRLTLVTPVYLAKNMQKNLAF